MALKSLLELVDRANAKLTEGDIAGLLWCRCRKLITTMDQLFDLDAWHRVGIDLWDSMQVGNKEARHLVPVFRTVKNIIADIVLVLAAAGNKSATRPPLPPPRCGGEWKENRQKTGGSG